DRSFFFLRLCPPPRPPLFPYTTLFRSRPPTLVLPLIGRPPARSAVAAGRGLATAGLRRGRARSAARGYGRRGAARPPRSLPRPGWEQVRDGAGRVSVPARALRSDREAAGPPRRLTRRCGVAHGTACCAAVVADARLSSIPRAVSSAVSVQSSSARMASVTGIPASAASARLA